MLTKEHYWENLGPEQTIELKRIHGLIKSWVPQVEEVFSYGMPGFKYKKAPLVWVGAFADHYSVFPTGGPVAALKDQLTGYKLSKGTIQFTKAHPLPDELLKLVVSHRRKEIDAGVKI